MESEAKPVFNIIEGYVPDVDYEEFKEDFINPHILVSEIREKYNISQRVYNEYRDRVLKETGLWKKPNIAHQRFIKGVPLTSNYKSAEYIREIKGDYVVVKTIGYDTRYYGRYEDYETAKKVRDVLVENNWNQDIGMELKELYGKHRLKPSLDKAKEVFDEFEKRYFFDRDTLIVDIREEMDISMRTYQYLLMMLRNKHGNGVKRGMYD